MTREEFEAAYGQFFGQAQTRPINVDDMPEEDRSALIAHPGVHQDVKSYARAKQMATALAERIYDNDIPRHLRW